MMALFPFTKCERGLRYYHEKRLSTQMANQETNFDSCATKLQKISCKKFFKNTYVT